MAPAPIAKPLISPNHRQSRCGAVQASGDFFFLTNIQGIGGVSKAKLLDQQPWTLQDAWVHAEIIRARYLRRSYVAGHSQIITTLMLQPTSILWVHIWRIQIGKSKMLEVIDETGV